MNKKKPLDKDASNLMPVSNALNELIEKEISIWAALINLEREDLQAWIDLHSEAPKKAILQLLRLAIKHQLDPITQEVGLAKYANDEWQAFIGINGWITLMNRHPAFQGISFNESKSEDNHIWMECSIYRSDRLIPVTVREYLTEVYTPTDIWQKMPLRMLRHKVLIQCARLSFGINSGFTEEGVAHDAASNNSEESKTPKFNLSNGQGLDKTINRSAILKKILVTAIGQARD